MNPFNDRYHADVVVLKELFSEENYLRIIFDIEIAYLKSYASACPEETRNQIQSLDFNYDYRVIKEIEETTKHDVSAVMTYIQGLCQKGISTLVAEDVHIGLTSQDVVSLTYAILASKSSFILQTKAVQLVHLMHDKFKNKTLVGFTHGQKATKVSANEAVLPFLEEMNDLVDSFRTLSLDIQSRFLGGACGDKDAIRRTGGDVARVLSVTKTEFLKRIEMEHAVRLTIVPSRQTDYYPTVVSMLLVIENMAELLEREAVNMWLYCSSDTLSQANTKGSVGSSAMSQKINPISFENCEGNAVLASAVASTIKKKIRKTRLDRDLSDLTVLRNLGMPVAYLFMAMTSFMKGLNSIEVNEVKIENELDNSYEMLAETVLLRLKFNNEKDSQKKCLQAFKGKKNLTHSDYVDIINQMDISSETKKELLTYKI